MHQLDAYFHLQKQIYDYFGYKEDWVVIPLDDCRQYFWHLQQEQHGGGSVYYAPTLKDLKDPNSEQLYRDAVYTQRFLPKWVYEGPEYTMICCDPGVDGNKFLRVFENAKRQQ